MGLAIFAQIWRIWHWIHELVRVPRYVGAQSLLVHLSQSHALLAHAIHVRLVLIGSVEFSLDRTFMESWSWSP
jgi:hypothetical protein